MVAVLFVDSFMFFFSFSSSFVFFFFYFFKERLAEMVGMQQEEDMTQFEGRQKKR